MTVVTRSSEEFYAVCARERAGELRVHGLERGAVVPAGKHRNGRTKTQRLHVNGWWTFHVSDQRDLL